MRETKRSHAKAVATDSRDSRVEMARVQSVGFSRSCGAGRSATEQRVEHRVYKQSPQRIFRCVTGRGILSLCHLSLRHHRRIVPIHLHRII